MLRLLSDYTKIFTSLKVTDLAHFYDAKMTQTLSLSDPNNISVVYLQSNK